MEIRRPHNSQDHLHRNHETSPVDVTHLDVVLGHDIEAADDHVTSGESEANRPSRCSMLVEKCVEALRSARLGIGRLFVGEQRPACLGELDLGDLTRSFDGGVVLSGGDDPPAESVTSEFDRDPVTPVDHLLDLIRQCHAATPVQLGEPLVLGGFLRPFPARSLTELGGEVRIRLVLVVHGFSRSRHLATAAG